MRRCSQVAFISVLLAALTACGESSTPSAPSSTTPASSTLASIQVDPSVMGGQPAQGSVTLSAPAPQSGLTITLTSDNAALTVPSSVTIPAGATTASFQIATSRVTTTTEVMVAAQAGEVRRTAAIRLRIDPTSLRPTASYTVGFSALTNDRASFTTHVESGFTISAMSGPWITLTGFGNPRPFIEFISSAGVTTTGEVRITAGGNPFWLRSVDFYSSTTRIPYVIEGFLSSEPVFTLIDVLGNTFGNFARVSNPHAATPVDVLLIRLSNPSAPCCTNPMGLDNIVLNR